MKKIILFILIICSQKVHCQISSQFEVYNKIFNLYTSTIDSNIYKCKKNIDLIDSIFDLTENQVLLINKLIKKANKISKQKFELKRFNKKTYNKLNNAYLENLKEIYLFDQKIRKNIKSFDFSLNDSLNLERLKKLIIEYGVPKLSTVGKKGVFYFGVLINHSIFHDKLVNESLLNFYFDQGAISNVFYAWAFDKYLVLVKKSKPKFNLFNINTVFSEDEVKEIEYQRSKIGIYKFF